MRDPMKFLNEDLSRKNSAGEREILIFLSELIFAKHFLGILSREIRSVFCKLNNCRILAARRLYQQCHKNFVLTAITCFTVATNHIF